MLWYLTHFVTLRSEVVSPVFSLRKIDFFGILMGMPVVNVKLIFLRFMDYFAIKVRF